MERGMMSVDKWSSGSQAYFLTHLRADHTAGLSSTWKRGPLFCSRLTAKLFPCKFPGFDLSLLRVLDNGCWHSLSLTTPSSGSAASVYVKAIDAQHCPVYYDKTNFVIQTFNFEDLCACNTHLTGSVMYLFRGEFCCMLYTGDFRWEKTGNEVENRRAMLLYAIKNETLNILYLDNTYCNLRYLFPCEVAARQIVDIITSHPKHDIIIGIDSLGKEDFLIYVSRVTEHKGTK